MRRFLLAAALLAPGAARAAVPKDLEGSWLGRMGCTDAAFRMTLRLVPRADEGWDLRYSLRQLSGKGASRSGTGTLSPDGALSLSKPIPNPLLPDNLPGRLEFKDGSPHFTGRTDLGAVEHVAGAATRCALEKGGERLTCGVEWRLLQEAGDCRLRLLRKGADKGPLPCPDGYVPSKSGTACDPR